MKKRNSFSTQSYLTPLAFSFLAAGLFIGNSQLISAEELVDRNGIESYTTQSVKKQQSKVSDDLRVIVTELQSRATKSSKQNFSSFAHSSASKPIFVTKENGSSTSIEVYIHLNQISAKSISILESQGVVVDVISKQRPIIQAMVPIESVDEISNLSFVREITRPSYALPTAGQVSTEGDSLQGTNFVRAGFTYFSSGEPRVDGTGVTVGVLSSGLYTVGAFDVNTFVNPFGTGTCNILQAESGNPIDPTLVSDLPNLTDNCPDNNEDNQVAVGFFGDIPIFPADFDEHTVGSGFVNGIPVSVDTGQPNTPYPEGTAMMEVIHDIAPGAEFIYSTARTTLDLELSREFFVPTITIPGDTSNPRNIDVVVDNLIFFSDGRFDGSSAVSRGASELARTRNIPYFVSVGGQTISDYSSKVSVDRFPLFVNSFFNPDPRENRSTIHSWSDRVTFDRDEALDVELNGDQPLEITLVWDDVWDDFTPKSDVDFDLYLVPKTTLSLADAVASSTRIQNGSGSNPSERLVYFGTSSEPLALVLVNKDGNANDKTFFTIVIESGTVIDSKYLTHGVPVNNADALAPVVSVGHLDTSKSFTDLSTTTDIIPGIVPGAENQKSFFKWYDNQVAPGVVSYGSVSTRVTGDRGFVGPSAAVAHMGGFAALLRHRYPQLPPNRIAEFLRDTSGESDTKTVIPPLARKITPQNPDTVDLSEYYKSPEYIRSNPFAIYSALVEGDIDAYGTTVESEVEIAFVDGSNAESFATSWTPINGQPVPASGGVVNHRVSSMGLEISPQSAEAVGGWKSPTLQMHDGATGLKYTELKSDKTYMIEARIGSNMSNPEFIPNFQIKVENADGSVYSGLKIDTSEMGYGSAPATLGGKTYQLFLNPKEAEAFKFSFETLGNNEEFSEGSTLMLRDLKIVEMPRNS